MALRKEILAVEISRELKNQLRQRARRNERTMSGEARIALRRHLKAIDLEVEKDDQPRLGADGAAGR